MSAFKEVTVWTRRQITRPIWRVIGKYAISRMLHWPFSAVLEWQPLGDKYYTETKLLQDTSQRGQDQLYFSNHLLITPLLPAYIKEVSGICWRLWDWVSRQKVTPSYKTWERGYSPFRPVKWAGFTRLITWKTEVLPPCAGLLCALVLLTGPFEQVRVIGERWKAEWSSPTSTLGTGNVLEFLCGPVHNGSPIRSQLSVTQSLGRWRGNRRRRLWLTPWAAERAEMEGCLMRSPWSRELLPTRGLCPWKHLHRCPFRKSALGHLAH